CLHLSQSAEERGVTTSSGIPARAGSSNDELARGQTTAPCLLPQASRVPAARCAGWLQAQAPGPSSTTTRRRRGRRALPHAPLRRAAPARRPRVRGAAPARNLASSRSRRPASEVPCEAARLRLATARDAIHRRASLGMPVRRACPSVRLPATLRPARVRVRTTPDALRATPPYVRHARHNGTRPRRALSTPATLRLPRAGGVAPRHWQSGAPRACS